MFVGEPEGDSEHVQNVFPLSAALTTFDGVPDDIVSLPTDCCLSALLVSHTLLPKSSSALYNDV